MYILPPTYVGGDRYSRQNMHNIITVAKKVGHPGIFLTMTCSPQWPEKKTHYCRIEVLQIVQT